MTCYLFAGQGIQRKGMGKDLFHLFPNLISIANTILGYDIEALCVEDAFNQLDQTEYTQPAIYVVNSLFYFKSLQEDAKPNISFLAGHSLGEYNALLAAGVVDFETGLRLVKKRGELMSRSTSGTMAAIIGLTQEQVQLFLSKNNINNVEIANYNSYTQVVISGLKHDMIQAQALFTQENKHTIVIPLRVDGPFHSSYMYQVREEFASFLQNFLFKPPLIPVLSNYTARPYTFSEIKKNLIEQITHPVRWVEIVEYVLKHKEAKFKEIGLSTILEKLINKIQNGQ
jgi:malonyl CoA-acyl carrier protein transacylase